MQKIFTVFFTLVLFAGVANADVNSRKTDSHFIKVTKNQDQTVRFELCSTTATEVCSPVGKRSYSAAELNWVRNKLYLKSAGLVVADIAGGAVLTQVLAGVFGIATGVFAEAYLGTSGAATAGAAIWGAVAGVGTGLGTSITVSVKWLNPMTRYRNGRTLRKAIVSDGDVTIKGSVKDYADRLGTVLATLN